MPFLRKSEKELSRPKHTVAMPKTHHEVLDKARLSRREQVLSFQTRPTEGGGKPLHLSIPQPTHAAADRAWPPAAGTRSPAPCQLPLSLVGLFTGKKGNDDLEGGSLASARFFSVRELPQFRPQEA